MIKSLMFGDFNWLFDKLLLDGLHTKSVFKLFFAKNEELLLCIALIVSDKLGETTKDSKNILKVFNLFLRNISVN